MFLCITVFVYQTTTSICTHHQQHAHHYQNKPMQGRGPEQHQSLFRPMWKSFILILFLLLTKCFAFKFSCLDYDIAHPLNDTHPVLPLQASAHRAATGSVLTWQQQWPATTTWHPQQQPLPMLPLPRHIAPPTHLQATACRGNWRC